MRKLHKVSYDQIFGKTFQTKQIDRKLRDLEIEEKLMILDNVIDYLYTNFALLTSTKDKMRMEQMK